MRVPRPGLVLVGLACAGLLSGEALRITTTPSHTPTHTPTPTLTPTPTATFVATTKPTPWLVGGPEIPLNEATLGDRRAPSLAPGADFGFLATWSSEGQDGDGSGVFARRFDRAGEPMGGEFQVNSFTTGTQDEPSIDSEGNGAFVIAWSSGADGDRDVHARRFATDGSPVGGEFLVNSYSTGDQHSPDVRKLANGFVVVWTSHVQDGDGDGVYGQKFSVNGVPDGAEFRVNETTTGDQRTPRLALRSDGFIAVWQSVGQDGDQGGIFARAYDPDGGSEFQVNDATAGDQSQPDVETVGGYLFTWASPDGDGSGVFARAFGTYPAPAPVGPEFRVNSSTAGNQSSPSVAGLFSWDPSPGFIVVWQSEGQEGPGGVSSSTVLAQRFDNAPSLTAVFVLTQQPPRREAEYRVDQSAPAHAARPAVARLQESGSFVVAWEGVGPGASGVTARKFNAPVGAFMNVDTVPSTGPSNVNGVLEPGERVKVSPAWKNDSEFFSEIHPLPLSGIASNPSGPLGSTLTIDDTLADYGSIDEFFTKDCLEQTGNCYEMTVGSDRPGAHWDTTFDESLQSTDPIGPMKKTWSLHVGDSFPDVPQDAFYPYVENIFHNGITGGGGCGAGMYCGEEPVLRQQMAVFLVRVARGPGYTPPPASGAVFDDVPASSPFAPWIEELARMGVTAGCASPPPPALPSYCPAAPVNRQQMAVFLLKTYFGGTFNPNFCVGKFDDVPCPSPFVNYVEYLSNAEIAAGCSVSPPLYCPADPTKRKQMAAFLVKTFGLELYGGD